MLSNSAEELDNELDSLSSQKNKRYTLHSIVSATIVIAIIGLILYGFLNGATNVNSLLPKSLKSIEPILSFKASNNYILVQTGNNSKAGELKLIDENSLTYDISNGRKDIINSALSGDAQMLSYVTKDIADYHLRVLKIPDLQPSQPQVSLSRLSGLIPQPVKPSDISLCDWSTLKWSPNGESILTYLCFKDKSVLAVVKVDKSKDHKVFESSISSSQPRSAIWLNGTTILYSKSNTLFRLNALTKAEEELYTIVK